MATSPWARVRLPHLHQLSRDGLIEGYWESAAGGRERKLYKITEKGKTALELRMAEWSKFRRQT